MPLSVAPRRPAKTQRSVRLAAALIVLVGAAGAASTEPRFADAERLALWCQGKGALRASCLGYLMGVADALRDPGSRLSLERGEPATEACLPAKLAPEQIRNLFLNYLHEDPDRARRGAAEQVRSALQATFPCAGGAPPPRAPAREREPRAPDVEADARDGLDHRDGILGATHLG